MKYIISFFLMVLWLVFANADQLVLPSGPTIRQVYTSESWKKYVFISEYEVVVPSGETEYQNLKNENQWNTNLGLVIWNQKYIIKDFSSPVCRSILKTQAKAILAHPDVKNLDNTKIIWTLPSKDCINYEWKTYLINADYNDIDYITQNYDIIINQVKTIWVRSVEPPLSKLRKIYSYVTKKSSYSYETIYTNNFTDFSPWKVSSFFQWKKIVCDAYVKSIMLIANLYNLKLERELGRTQPLDAWNVPAQNQYHVWLSYNWKYFDPTFDDSWNKETTYYFNQTKTCFQLNHYQIWDILFETTSQRYDYIVKNENHLLAQCPGILKITLVNDDNLQKFLVQKIKSSGIESIKPIAQILGYTWDMKNIGSFGISYTKGSKTTSFYFKDLIAQANQ